MKQLKRITFSLFALLTLQLCAAPVEIWISSQQDKDYYDKMVALYQEQIDKDFTATIMAYGFRELPDKLSVVIKTGEGAPDIVQLDEVFFGPYLAGEVPFVDLTERLNKGKLVDQFSKARMELFSDGTKIYGIPQSLSAMVLYYRADMFKARNIDPDSIVTWKDFRKVCETLSEDNIFGLALDPSQFEAFLRQRGSQIVNRKGEVLPDFDLAVDTLTYLVDLFSNDLAMTPERGSIFDPLFFSSNVDGGDVACMIGADWFGLDMLQQFAPNMAGKFAVRPLPAWEKDGKLSARTSSFAGQGLLIYKDSDQVEQSWKFIKWVMTDKEANKLRFTMGNSFPAYKPAWKDEELLKGNDYFTGKPMGKVLAEIADEVPGVDMHPKRPQALFMMQENFFSSALYGNQTPKEALLEFKKTLDQ
ncbi:MAG: arabinosaccharide transport system substrate-binding protein [Kiritimatiellia bacterium]|jgi:arabinosaccharide transport system substrate-binding protein